MAVEIFHVGWAKGLSIFQPVSSLTCPIKVDASPIEVESIWVEEVRCCYKGAIVALFQGLGYRVVDVLMRPIFIYSFLPLLLRWRIWKEVMLIVGFGSQYKTQYYCSL